MKKILATGGMLAYMLWVNATGNVVSAAGMIPEIAANDIQGPKHHQNARQTKNAEAKLERIAEKFGLDMDELRADIQSGMSTKEILKKNNITKHQLREVMGKKRLHTHNS